jgi:hypothetical protein
VVSAPFLSVAGVSGKGVVNAASALGKDDRRRIFSSSFSTLCRGGGISVEAATALVADGVVGVEAKAGACCVLALATADVEVSDVRRALILLVLSAPAPVEVEVEVEGEGVLAVISTITGITAAPASLEPGKSSSPMATRESAVGDIAGASADDTALLT